MAYYDKTDLIDGVFKIQFDQPLQHFTNDTVEAYGCTSINNPEKKLIAYILKSDYPPRLNIFKKTAKGFLFEEVSACVKINHTIDGNSDYKYVVIISVEQGFNTLTSPLAYNKELGRHYIADFKAIESKDNVITMIGNLYKTLAHLDAMDIFHGDIRPDNIYFHSDADFKTARLGACFLRPAGYIQPVLYETINRGICQPSIKGVGVSIDDIYSLGVSILVFLMGEEPLKDLTEEEILSAKMNDGSYRALVGDIKLAPELVMFFKGTLSDNALERWRLEDIEKWLLTGRSRKVAIDSRKIKRPIIIGDIECYSKRSASYAMFRCKNDAMDLLSEGKIQTWLEYACQDGAAKQSVEAFYGAYQQEKMDQEQLITDICAILAPENPILYSGFALCQNSLSKLFFDSMFNVKIRDLIKEIFVNNIYTVWASNQHQNAYLGQFLSIDKYRKIYMGQGINTGFEALLYMLNQNAYCYSKWVKKYKSNSVYDLLNALEKAAQEVDIETEVPFDKELICFIDAKASGDIQSFISTFNKDDQLKKMNALVCMYAHLQENHMDGPLPNLSKWMGKIILRNFKNLKDKNEFVRLTKLLSKKVKTGVLADLIPLANEIIYKENNIKFNYSKRLYDQMSASKEELQSYLGDLDLLHEKIGKPFSAIVSVVFSMIIMSLSLVILIGG